MVDVKSAYTAGLGEATVPRPVMTPLVRGELVGLIGVRPLKAGEGALTGIAELANIAAAAGRCDEERVLTSGLGR
ncbi:hypothetical protein [Streptomyces sp. NPDC048637]|uniref:hypothetical protein n=1 Tax=Streptomyces sp. NPDC048637 TaxID=3155636 RepID=UPI00343573E5